MDRYFIGCWSVILVVAFLGTWLLTGRFGWALLAAVIAWVLGALMGAGGYYDEP